MKTFSLIDSNAEMPTRAKQEKSVQAERLSARTSSSGRCNSLDCKEDNLQRATEMIAPVVG